MHDLDAIKRQARQRAERMNLGYAGALLPAEAHALLQSGAKIVDVRTRAELDFIGRIPGALFIEWSSYPEGRRNPEFLALLEAAAAKDVPLMFICRSGNRSHAAATVATQAGWAECYNVLEGFEGDRDENQHRNTIGGWKVAGLPWVQG